MPKNSIIAEAYVEDDHGHLFLYVLDDGVPMYRREYFIKSKHKVVGGHFNAAGFRRHQLDILDFIRHPDEELVLHRRNVTGEDYSMQIVGCHKTNVGEIERAILDDMKKQEEDGKLSRRMEKASKKHDKRNDKKKPKLKRLGLFHRKDETDGTPDAKNDEAAKKTQDDGVKDGSGAAAETAAE